MIKKIFVRLRNIFLNKKNKIINIRRSRIINKIYKYNTKNNDSFALKTQFKTKFLGITILEYPNDMWIMQEIITQLKPDFIIETGTFRGGSALYYASLLENINPKGKIITIDINPQIEKSFNEIKSSPLLYKRVQSLFKKYISCISASSVDEEIIKSLKKRTQNHKVLVALDSCHAYEHVLQELKMYSPLVSTGSYIVVFDTCVDKIADTLSLIKRKKLYKSILTENYTKLGGPYRAVKEFLLTNNSYIIDNIENRFFETNVPSGYLKKIK